MNQAQFLEELGKRNAEREELRARAANVLRAIDVYKRRVENLHDVVVPGFTWIASFVAAIWLWKVLDAHLLVDIVSGHVIFRCVARVYINAIWIPRSVRELARRFPEFRTEIEDSFAKINGGEDD